MKAEQPRVVLVVPCRNDAALLRHCLASFRAQTTPVDGIIVVDNGSADDTVDTAKDYGATIITEPRVGITWAMRAGLDEAARLGFDVALRVDADVTAPPNFMQRLHRALAEAAALSGTGNRTVVAVTGDARFNIPGWRGAALSRLYLGAYRISVGSALGHPPLFGSNCAIDLAFWHAVRDEVDSADTFVHDDIQLSFAVRPLETVWYRSELIVTMDDRALRGRTQLARRSARGWYSMIRGFHSAPPWKRLPQRWRAGSRVGLVSFDRHNVLRRYDGMSHTAANTVIEAYSTSFSLATRLLPRRIRRDIRNLYAVVRIADEIVDGTAAQAHISDIDAVLTAYEAQVLGAPEMRFHTDPVLHAYAETARRCQFNPAHVRAFFSSMRRDLHQDTYDAADFDDYVYGSAEVIGLLCLSAFIVDMQPTAIERAQLEDGARRLGAAFQKVNFLRDLGEDSDLLGRSYFPHAQNHEITGPNITDAIKAEIIADIRSDLDAAKAPTRLLPRTVRAAVTAAANLFTELTDMIEATPASDLARTRVSVPRHRKLLLSAQAVADTLRNRT